MSDKWTNAGDYLIGEGQRLADELQPISEVDYQKGPRQIKPEDIPFRDPIYHMPMTADGSHYSGGNPRDWVWVDGYGWKYTGSALHWH